LAISPFRRVYQTIVTPADVVVTEPDLRVQLTAQVRVRITDGQSPFG
jgi:hypothetical protein